MTDDLDTRARAGATALRDAVRHLPVDPTDRRSRAPRHGRVLVLAAAAVALVALTLALVARRGDEQRLTTDPPGSAPRLVLDAPPPGMTASGAVDLPLTGESTAHGAIWVYGEAGAPEPFATSDLALIQWEAPGGLVTPADGSERTDVAGHAAWVSPPPDDPADLGRHTVYVELDGSTLGLMSRTLSDVDLLAAANDLDLDAVPLDPPDGLGGLTQIGTASGALSPGATTLLFPVGTGHLVGYTSDTSEGDTSAGNTSDGGRTSSVASAEGGDGLLAITQWAFGATIDSVEVAGVDAWSGSPYGEGSSMLVWQESPTVVVAVAGFGVDDATLLAAAESVRPATDAEWTELLAMTNTATVPRDALVGVSSEGIGGTGYAAYLDADGSLCISYESSGVSRASCSGGSEHELQASTERLDSGEIVLYGYTTLGTDGDLRIEAADGTLAGLSEAYGEGGTLFAGVFTDATLPAEIVVRGADGAELHRVPVAAPGSGLGLSDSGVEGASTSAP